MVTDQQVRKLMRERKKGATIEVAAAKAGMSRKTASKYLASGQLPSTNRKPRRWRTRVDPFEADWPEMVAMLEEAPELEAKALFEYLVEKTGARYQPGQLRTVQRKVRRWRALHGPDKEVFFPQRHRPGEAAQTDFTHANELHVTLAGERFDHLLCVVTLPYSKWTWATVCRSESMAALRRGLQEALFRLGSRPTWHQTDNSTAATHNLGAGKRAFNDDYVKLMNHLDLKPRTIAKGQSHQNGSVEARNGALKRRLEQHLLLRGSRDFASMATYEAWIGSVLDKANATRTVRVTEETSVMAPLVVNRMPEWTEVRPKVTSWSTIRVQHNAYSVPARLIGEEVRVRIFDDRLEVYFAEELQCTPERLHGRFGHRIDYRHVIWWLVRKPAAFARYRYREDLFPAVVFRRTYDALCEHRSARDADLAYLRVLHLAASTLQSDVEVALDVLLDAGQVPDPEVVKSLVEGPRASEVPELAEPEPDLEDYDDLLEVHA
ncbi:MAG: IS21 family transposase [Planctomycetota bacterium]